MLATAEAVCRRQFRRYLVKTQRVTHGARASLKHGVCQASIGDLTKNPYACVPTWLADGQVGCRSTAELCGPTNANTAAHLVDRVLADVPVRMYAASPPFEQRPSKCEVLRTMARLFVESILAAIECARCRMAHGRRAGCGHLRARFACSLNLNVHIHVVMVDRVFVSDADNGVVFHLAHASMEQRIGSDKIAIAQTGPG